MLRENGKFYESKMRWLRDNTTNGHTYYAYGKEASLQSIIYRLLETMTDEIREKFSIKTTYSQTCNVNSSHNLCRHFTHNVLPISTDDVLDKHLFLNSQEFDVIQVIKHKLTLDNFVGTSKCPVLVDDNSVANSENSASVISPKPSTYGAMLRQSVAVINTPDIFLSVKHIVQPKSILQA